MRCVLHALLFASCYARSNVFVHLLEWKWTDIEFECVDYLGPHGFTGVQISPPVEHATNKAGAWFERYQPASYLLNSRSGNQAELESMIRTCKKAGVKVYIDAVFNDMATHCGVGFAGTRYCNRTYGLPTPFWKPEDFHHVPDDASQNCRIDFDKYQNNTASGGDPPSHEMWYCDLCKLPDLATEKPHVQQKIAEHLVQLIDIGAGGFRVDAAKHIPPEQLQEIMHRVQKSRNLPEDIILETFSNETKPVKPSMYSKIGLLEYFDYQKHVCKHIAHPGRMAELRHVDKEFAYPSESVVAFLDNHDTQRDGLATLTYRNGSLYTLANVFMLAWPYGYPKLMSSFRIPDYLENGTDVGPPQHPVHEHGELNCGPGKPWVCEHRDPLIANMVAWRRIAGSAKPRHWIDDSGDRIAFARGAAFVALNRNSNDWSVRVQTGLPKGHYCDISKMDQGSCPYVQVNDDGTAQIVVPAMSALALHTEAKTSFAKMPPSGIYPVETLLHLFLFVGILSSIASCVRICSRSQSFDAKSEAEGGDKRRPLILA